MSIHADSYRCKFPGCANAADVTVTASGEEGIALCEKHRDMLVDDQTEFRRYGTRSSRGLKEKARPASAPAASTTRADAGQPSFIRKFPSVARASVPPRCDGVLMHPRG